MLKKKLNPRQQTEVRMTVLLGIIQQLLTTRQNRLFANRNLSLSQFGLLNHFTHTPEQSWTITELVEVMEMNQPGITKIATVLLDKGLLKSMADKADKRKRYLSITQKGMALCEDTFKSLLPEISDIFGEWHNQELEGFHTQLEKLMQWLDEHRHDDSPSPAIR
ncbi:MAG: DNA-binding MarR family transcriptional regulator [Parasphingorhabdus sp.]|jgi:DNA-binding MarR family transcriptional regulator